MTATGRRAEPNTTLQELSGKWPLIHWCTTGRGLAPGGDFKKSLVRPNYRASVVQNGTLTTPETAWQKLVSTGEYESEDSLQHGQQQMLHHLLEHLRYNPELREGFVILRLKSGSLRFASANACSIFVTRNQPAESADALIAYVVLVYEALHHRNTSVELVEPPTPTTSTNPRYRLRHKGSHYEFDATIARHRPGRATFGGLNSDRSYFCKLSLQDYDDSYRSEQFFYTAAHAKDGGLPGLARVTAAWTDDTPVPDNPYDPTESGTERHLEVTILSCVGKDITFCKNVRQSLSVMHDTIDVSRRLALKHMMHGDFSAGNVLCDPMYEDGKQPTSPTCAEAVTDTLSPSPQCLVVDLDHAKVVQSGSTDPANFEVTGTPLYMSSELKLDADRRMFWSKRAIPTLQKLIPPIPPKLSGRFEQMFPEYKTFDALQAALQCVLDQTAELFGEEDDLVIRDVPLIHAPRHDLESIFWVFSIFFAGALPKGAENKPKDARKGYMFAIYADSLDIFMSGMQMKYGREGRFDCIPSVEAVLHPQLEALAPLLHKIASLLFCIPWCALPAESTTTMPHPTAAATTAASSLVNMLTLAHDVVRYMLLAFLLDGRNSEILGTELTTGVTRNVLAPARIFRSASTVTCETSDSDQSSSFQQAQTGEDPPLVASTTDFLPTELATGAAQELHAPATMSRGTTAVKRTIGESNQAPPSKRAKGDEARV